MVPPPYSGNPALSPPSPQTPLTFGQILDRIFRLMRLHWKPFLGIGLLPSCALLLYYAFFFGALYFAGIFKNPRANPDPATMFGVVLPLGLLFLPIVLALYGLFHGAISFAALQAIRQSQVTARSSFRHAWSKISRYIWLMVLQSLIAVIPILVCAFFIGSGAALLGFVKHGNANPAGLFFLVPLAILIYLGAIAYAVIVFLRLSLAFAACVGEDLAAWKAIKRSGVLTQGAKGRIFLVLLVTYALGYVAFMVFYAVGLLVFAVGAVASQGHLQSASPTVILFMACTGVLLAAVFLIWTAIMLASYSVALAVLYYDQRLRKEGPAFLLLPNPVLPGA